MSENKRMGALYGAVVGDLLGIPHEFSDPSEIPRGRLMPSGGGPFNFEPGVGSDDTDLLLAAIDSYDHNQNFDANDMVDHLINWYRAGPQDVGTTTAMSICDWIEDRAPLFDAESQGNGGLMRAAAHGIMSKTIYRARSNAIDDTTLTHNSFVAADCSAIHALIVWRLINSPEMAVEDAIRPAGAFTAEKKRAFGPYTEPQSNMHGHCVHSLRLAKWALLNATSFEDGITRVIRTGGDTDTNGAIAGALLGARFGEGGIPAIWLAGIGPELRARIERVRATFKVKENENS